MTRKEFQLKHSFTNEEMDAIEYLFKSTNGKITSVEDIVVKKSKLSFKNDLIKGIGLRKDNKKTNKR